MDTDADLYSYHSSNGNGNRNHGTHSHQHATGYANTHTYTYWDTRRYTYDNDLAYTDRDSYHNNDCYSRTHGDALLDGLTNGDTRNAHGDCDDGAAYRDGNRRAWGDTYLTGNAHGHRAANCNGSTNCNRHAHAYGHLDAAAHRNTIAYPYPFAPRHLHAYPVSDTHDGQQRVAWKSGSGAFVV